MSSYKLRRVPENWAHPKDANEQYIPLLDGSYSEYSQKYDLDKEMWNKGFYEGLDKVLNASKEPNWIPVEEEDKQLSFEEWDGEKCKPEDFRPDWPPSEQTHFQMYEDVTEGTPISPVFEKAEDLAFWLCQNLDDDRYPYTTSEWLTILTSSQPSVEVILTVPRDKSFLN